MKTRFIKRFVGICLLSFITLPNLLADGYVVRDGIYYVYAGDTAYIGAFDKNSTISDIILKDTIQYHNWTYNVTAIAKNAFYKNHTIKNLVIPNSVLYIADNAFLDADSLQYVQLPSDIKILQPYVFMNCSSLVEIDIPKGVTTIRENAFRQCYSLKKAVIPASVTQLMDGAFANVPFNEGLYVSWTDTANVNTKYLSGYPFEGVPKSANLFVPVGYDNWYSVTDPWKRFNVKTGYPTAVEPITVNPSSSSGTKIFIDNQLFILRDDKLYSPNGQIVK